MVGETRSISVSSSVTFTDVSAIMSDSSIPENGKELSEMQRVTLLLHMMEQLVFPEAKLTREVKLKTIGYANDVMGLEVCMSLLEKLHKTWKDQRKDQVAVYDFKPRKGGIVGRKTKLTPSLRAKYVEIIEKYAFTFRTLTAETLFDELEKLQANVCQRTVYNHLEHMNAFYHKLYLKPHLSDEHRVKRMEWAIFLVDSANSFRHRDRQLYFRDMFDCVMVDEKWFYLMVDGVKIKLLPGMEVAIQPKAHHKCHIEKVMFLSCVARPLFNEDGSVKFSGLVKVVPVVQEYIAQRTTKNQRRGDVMTKNHHVNSETYHNLFVKGGVFDAAEEKTPWLKSFTYIQDGAKAHTAEGSVRELEKAGSDPLTVPVADRVCAKFLTQPAQSPDVNVNDCAFFSSLQTQIRKKGTYNTNRQEYLDLVKEEFEAFDPYRLDRIWAIMFDNLRSILKNRGGNDYQPEHNGKRKRQKDAGTAVDLTVPMEDYHECVRLVREYRRDHPIE